MGPLDNLQWFIEHPDRPPATVALVERRHHEAQEQLLTDPAWAGLDLIFCTRKGY
jgi:hypothetical protein